MKQNNFEKWLYSVTAERHAKKLQVKIRAVFAWRAKENKPSAQSVKKILKAAKGQVSKLDISNHFGG